MTPMLPFPLPARPVKRETLSVWQAAVLFDLAYAIDPVADDPARPLAVLNLKGRRAPDKPRSQPVPTGTDGASDDPLYIPPFLQGAPERLAAKVRAERVGT